MVAFIAFDFRPFDIALLWVVRRVTIRALYVIGIVERCVNGTATRAECTGTRVFTRDGVL